MRKSFKIGFHFGSTSGIITTLGLIVGLHSGTHLKAAVIGGIVTIAIADAMSDALGIHLAEEAKTENNQRHVWEATTATLLTKFIFAISFVVPMLLFELNIAVLVNLVWGILLLILINYSVAKKKRVKCWKLISEHLLIAIMVILLTHYLGDWVAENF